MPSAVNLPEQTPRQRLRNSGLQSSKTQYRSPTPGPWISLARAVVVHSRLSHSIETPPSPQAQLVGVPWVTSFAPASRIPVAGSHYPPYNIVVQRRRTRVD